MLPCAVLRCVAVAQGCGVARLRGCGAAANIVRKIFRRRTIFGLDSWWNCPTNNAVTLLSTAFSVPFFFWLHHDAARFMRPQPCQGMLTCVHGDLC